MLCKVLLHFKSCLRQLYIGNKKEHFSCKGGCGMHILYSAKWWRGKTLANRLFQSFGEENVGEFKL